jgi:hypothetical protein
MWQILGANFLLQCRTGSFFGSENSVVSFNLLMMHNIANDNHDGVPMSDSIKLIDLETRAARIAASLDARPHIGAIWRRATAIGEAAASLGLEDITVQEADILRPVLDLGLTQGEPQSTTIARGIHQVLLRPSSLLAEPENAFQRIYATAYMSQALESPAGLRIDYPSNQEAHDWKEARDLFAKTVRSILSHPAPIFLKSLAVAKLGAEVAPQRYPMAERMLFTAAESELRREQAYSDPIISRQVAGLDRRVDACWVLLPATALSHGGFRAWSPISVQGQINLIDRLHSNLGREAGRIGQIVAWHDRLQTLFKGKTRKSTRDQFSDLIAETPIITGGSAAQALGTTERTARNLIHDAVEMDLLKPLTNRKMYRMWAIPVLADIVQQRTRKIRDTGEKEAVSRQPDVAAQNRHLVDAGFEARSARAISELDDAVAKADRILQKYKIQSTET